MNQEALDRLVKGLNVSVIVNPTGYYVHYHPEVGNTVCIMTTSNAQTLAAFIMGFKAALRNVNKVDV